MRDGDGGVQPIPLPSDLPRLAWGRAREKDTLKGEDERRRRDAEYKGRFALPGLEIPVPKEKGGKDGGGERGGGRRSRHGRGYTRFKKYICEICCSTRVSFDCYVKEVLSNILPLDRPPVCAGRRRAGAGVRLQEEGKLPALNEESRKSFPPPPLPSWAASSLTAWGKREREKKSSSRKKCFLFLLLLEEDGREEEIFMHGRRERKWGEGGRWEREARSSFSFGSHQNCPHF